MKIAIGILSLLVAASCTAKLPPAQTEVVERVVVKTQPIKTPKPIVPPVDQLQLREVNWIVITPENIEETFASLNAGKVVLFAVTAQGYENLTLNLSDIRAMVAQQKAIIAIYEKSFKD